jgi:EAL domain-containing protein (putative c-di-GMP-specific phosphodiesterase class I)
MSETNDKVVFSTFEEKLEKIKQRLINDFKLGMLVLDASNLKNIEYNYGKTIYESIFETLKRTVANLKITNQIRKDDIITINQSEGNQFYIFLSKRRDEGSFHLSDYEQLSERIQIYINTNMFDTIYPLIKEKPRINIGYAIAFNNPSIKEERILQTMISEAETIARHQEIRNVMNYKEKVYELIIEKKIKTFYQPIVNIASHEILGYEALSRGPEGTEFENPYVLFTVAKDIGLLYELDWLCKINIFKDAKNLAKKKKLFVNIFSSSIHDSEIRVKYLEDLLNETNLKPKDVVFEISERYAIEDADFFNEITKLYSHTSFAIAIDDTWIGSNIALLKNLKIQYIKLNMSLIRDIDKHTLSRELIDSLKKIAQQVDAEIIAEGIQTKKELTTLIDMGIKYGQGYLFAVPGPAFPEVNITEIYLEDEGLKNRLLSSVFFKRAMDYFKKGQFDQSILEFTKVLEIDKENNEALFHRAHAYYEDGCYGLALKELEHLLKINPDYVDAHLTMALAAEKCSNNELAIQSYLEYIKNAPSIYQSNIDLAKKRLEELLKNQAAE